MDKDVELTAKGIKKASEGEPIRSIDDIELLKAYFRNKGKSGKLHKYYVYLITGLNSALRVSDILAIKVKDVKTGKLSIIERKTRKRKTFQMNNYLKETLETWIKQEQLEDEDFIFFSNMTINGKEGEQSKTFSRSTQHIDKSVVYKAFAKAVKETGIKVHYSNHCLRKTFAYHLYQRTHDLGLVQALLNHSTSATTLKYIGITQNVLDEQTQAFVL